MEIIELSEDSAGWRKLIKENESWIFHTPEFKSLIEDTFKCEVHYFAAKENEEIKTIFPFYYIKNLLLGKKIISVAFLEYGGPCGDAKYVVDIVNHVYGKYPAINYIEVREGVEGYDIVLSRLMKRSTDYKRFVLKLTSEEQILKNVDKQKKKALRKAENSGIKVRDVPEEELKVLYRLYLKNMRAFGSPPYSKKFFVNFYKQIVKNKFGKVVGSYYNNKLISALLGYCYKDRIHIVIAMSDKKYINYRPNEVMHWHFIKYGLDNKYKYFDFGRVREESGQFRFKKEWGCELKPLNHYYLLVKDKELPHMDPNNPKYRLLINIWRIMPLFITRIIGPWLRTGLGI